jgi:hypothetical protein
VEPTNKDQKKPSQRIEEKQTAAEVCPVFLADDEDEWVSDDPVSCFNCRFRRWTAESFICVHPQACREVDAN